jgi:hypothetical protein
MEQRTEFVTRPTDRHCSGIMRLHPLIVFLLATCAAAVEVVHPQLPFDADKLTVIDEVDVAAIDPGHRFQVWPDASVATRQKILGRSCLSLPNGAKAPDRYIAVRLGEGKGLQTGTAYVLQIEYPEDAPRSLTIWNTGNETCRSFHTGAALGDALKMLYVTGNPESLAYPLAKAWRTWTTVFELHQRYPELKRTGERALTPADGFTVVIANYQHDMDPVSQGAAVGRIRLLALPDPKALELAVRLPPAGLPQRHLFWREEMADGILETRKAATPGFDGARQLEWYAAKMRLMKFLGMNTFCKDMLEFGHNQGWDSSKFGGNAWVNQPDKPQQWHGLVGLAGEMRVNVLPMYEYCGSIGQQIALGPQKRCKTLAQAGKGKDGSDDYTHIWWSEKANADVTDPDTVEDLRKILEITIADESKRAAFVGAWLRPRSAGLPISFSDRCLGLFASESQREQAPTRQQLQADKALYQAYLDWWFGRRHAFFEAIRDYLRKPEVIGDRAVLLFTGDPSEPGRIIDEQGIVTDDATRFPGAKTIPFARVVAEHRTLKAETAVSSTWGGWEWQHAVPQLDPQRYATTPGIMLTMAFSRQYTVSDPAAMEAFRTPDGLAMIRHYPLNEHCFGKTESKDAKDHALGYFVSDFEEAGPYSMLAEARALAYGDPRFIGYLSANSFQRGFPAYARAFNRAFLALPAVPSTRLDGAARNDAVVVRRYPTSGNGTWFAVVNTGMSDARDVRIDLKQTKLSDACTGEPVRLAGTVATVSLYPGQVLAWQAP